MFCGRRVQRPAGPAVRPTQDRVREALFSSLAPRLPGCAFLDLYAGTGAVGLEAWSRGADRVCWVEASPRIFRGLQNQIRMFSQADQQVRLEPVCLDANVFCRRWSGAAPFDIVYADPPYAQAEPDKLLAAIISSGLLQDDGILVLEQGADAAAPLAEGWHLLRDKRYGGSRLRMFRKGKMA